jgi:hypothetical protein
MNSNPEVTSILDEVDRAMNDQTISLSRLIAMMSRRAAQTMNRLMGSANEHIALKASSDILDRTPEASKTFKHSVTSWSFEGEDAKDLARALVMGAKAREKYLPIAAGDFVRVDTDKESDDGAQGKEEAGPQVREQSEDNHRGDRSGGSEVRHDSQSERGLPASEGGTDEGR